MTSIRCLLIAALVLVASCSSLSSSGVDAGASGAASSPIAIREFNPTIDGKWIGNGISYGAYRNGEGPDNDKLTSKANILEDLQMVAQRWNLILLLTSCRLNVQQTRQQIV